jgi:hypothetical protein
VNLYIFFSTKEKKKLKSIHKNHPTHNPDHSLLLYESFRRHDAVFCDSLPAFLDHTEYKQSADFSGSRTCWLYQAENKENWSSLSFFLLFKWKINFKEESTLS